MGCHWVCVWEVRFGFEVGLCLNLQFDSLLDFGFYCIYVHWLFLVCFWFSFGLCLGLGFCLILFLDFNFDFCLVFGMCLCFDLGIFSGMWFVVGFVWVQFEFGFKFEFGNQIFAWNWDLCEFRSWKFEIMFFEAKDLLDLFEFGFDLIWFLIFFGYRMIFEFWFVLDFGFTFGYWFCVDFKFEFDFVDCVWHCV